MDHAAAKRAPKFEAPLVWKNILLFVVLHSCIPAALLLLLDPQRRPHLATLGWCLVGTYISGLGVTGGAHRLWSHKAYKAKMPVQVLLMLLQTMAGQNSIYTWCRDHRVHHKFSETDADPHNIKRGFFFAHMGWLCCRKHPEVREKGALIDMSDLEANPVVMFQHRHFWWLSTLFTVLLPTMLPVWLWNEHVWTSFIFSFMIRYLITLHGTWLVNSAAHYFGSRPYDKRIEARESPMVILYGLGEGFHNYHHTFPYDYSTSEFGRYFNITTAFIDMCASMGLVYDRRKIDKETILGRRQRTGEDDHDLLKTK
jgi:stearoyl-CoA desaturase (delta-9 desaturase)